MSAASVHRAGLGVGARPYVVAFSHIGPGDLALVGGKGQNLGLMTRAGAAVPPGFCVTTHAFRAFVAEDEQYRALLDELRALDSSDLDAVRDLGARLRAHLGERDLPADVVQAVLEAWRELGADQRYAVRSSATAEDLPTASFAGQQDTYLNVRGGADIVARVRDCFASLYTDRAIAYRIERGVDHAQVALSAVVQVMVRASKSGIMFTADPISGHRGHLAIDAGFGLGESLVSGLVSADLYKVDKTSGRILSVAIGDKKLAIVPAAEGGTVTVDLPEDQRQSRVLDDDEIARVAALGCQVEALYHAPQDIEWCMENDALYLVQTRPITSLYPVPEPPRPVDPYRGPGEPMRAYACFNHLQVMTDAMPAMSASIWQLLIPFGRSAGEIRPSPWTAFAGGRLFVDAAPILRQPLPRRLLLGAASGIDDLTGRSLALLAERERLKPGPKLPLTTLMAVFLPRVASAFEWLLVRDVTGQAAQVEAEIDELVDDVRAAILAPATVVGRLQVARAEMAGLLARLIYIPARIIAALLAGRLLRKLVRVEACDVEERAEVEADIAALARGLRGNVTTEMDLAVGDLADVARPHAELCARLVEPEVTRYDLIGLPGARAFSDALRAFLEVYGMRAPSEIDISRPRWRDDPSSILRTVAGNLAHGEAGAHRAHHQTLEARADAATERLLARARRGILGGMRASLARRFIRVHRELMALREHPKFAIVRIMDVIRSVVLDAGAALHDAGRLARTGDVWFLHIHELIDALEHPPADSQRGDLARLVAARAEEHARFQSMAPPRVMTDQGEIPTVAHEHGDRPEGALAGSPASAGVVEGVVKVVRDPTTEVLERGEILVAPFTDPGWTPLFLNAAGLVMEVGGLMTHGSVVAREYGIPAVVCVPDATTRLETGMRVRVDGDRGYVEVLDAGDETDAAT